MLIFVDNIMHQISVWCCEEGVVKINLNIIEIF